MTTESKELIELINAKWPKIEAVPSVNFDGHQGSDGVWFRGTEVCIIGELPVMSDPSNINPELEAFLTKNGWFAEPYDGGTLLAYKI